MARKFKVLININHSGQRLDEGEVVAESVFGAGREAEKAIAPLVERGCLVEIKDEVEAPAAATPETDPKPAPAPAPASDPAPKPAGKAAK